MKLSEHFYLSEFTASGDAARLGIDNSLPAGLLPSAKATAEMMERIRDYLCLRANHEVPILPSSGYRCLALNRALGSGDGSDHIKMLAVDFRAPEFGSPLAICRALVPQMSIIGIGQLIYEHTWVHVSSRTPDKAINRVLTVQGRNQYVPGIVGA